MSWELGFVWFINVKWNKFECYVNIPCFSWRHRQKKGKERKGKHFFPRSFQVTLRKLDFAFYWSNSFTNYLQRKGKLSLLCSEREQDSLESISTQMATCPRGFITYNATLCACPPGRLLNRTSNTCSLFTASSAIHTETGIAYSASFPETIFSFDSIKKFTQSQAVFLEATSVMLISWLLFCLFLRFMKLGDGRNVWFKIRWWISRLDVCFATRHWLVIHCHVY